MYQICKGILPSNTVQTYGVPHFQVATKLRECDICPTSSDTKHLSFVAMT